MTTVLRTRFLSGIIFIELIASAVFTVPARADSGSPPPAPTVPGGSTHGAAQVSSGVTNGSGTGNQGHKVELSNQDAAYIAPAGDPIWCPSGVAVPVPGAGGCSANYANLYSLTNAVETLTIHPVVTNSNIWIQHGVDTSANQIVLDGSVLAALSNVSLNFKGGWNGLGTGSVNPANPSTFNQGLRILSWINNITLSDIQFNHVLTGTLEGIYIKTKGNISLTRVQSNNNPGFGAYLDNTSGAGGVTITDSQFNGDAIPFDEALYVLSNNAITLTNVRANNGWSTILDNTTSSNKAVTIKSSSFDNTQAIGLIVRSKGAITLTNISASGNYNASSGGALIQNNTSITAAPVTLTGTNIFDSNLGTGLSVLSKGKITSASINASNNTGAGASFDNHTASTPLPVTLTGTSTFNANTVDGLEVFSNGGITANNLFADGNGIFGANLENNYSSTPSPVKLTGTNVLTHNGHIGLSINSYGAISLNNITTNGNGTSGGFDGLYASNFGALSPQSITLTGINNFNQNTLNGAELFATGKVSVSNVTVIGNTGGAGLLIDNTFLGSTLPQSVTLLGHNLLSNNQNDNLDISTYGAITINGLTASNSVSGKGAYLGFGPATPGNVTLNGLSTFINNPGEGLVIASKGIVLTNGLNAISNGGGGVVINNSFSAGPSPVTLKGINTFNFNGLGLEILSKGAVITNGLSAVSNTSDGVEIINNIAFTSPVTLKGLGTFNKNGAIGLDITSNGTVLTDSLNALSNSGIGVEIINSSSTHSPVTLKGLSTLNFNGPIGLQIISQGVVLTNGLNALSNSGIGVEIINSSSANSPVTLKGLNTFNNNNSIGLEIISNGAVITNSLNGINNSSIGVEIINSSVTAASPVTLKGLSTANLNSSIGLEIISNGTVVTNGLNAQSNGSMGVEIINSGATVPTQVTLKGINTFIDNNSMGLEVISNGKVLTNGLNAINNASFGVFIDNSASTSSAPLTLMGPSTFNSNSSFGLYLLSKGAVLTNGLNSINNGSYGVFIDNSASSTFAPVTLKGINTSKNNNSTGFYIVSGGAVLTNNLTAQNNANDGVYIDNSSSSMQVALNGLNTFNNNAGFGLDVASKGAITTNNVTSSFNGWIGVQLVNDYLGSSAGINIKGKNIILNNQGLGLDLYSFGPVTLTNVSAKLNNNDGLYVDTPGIVIVTCAKFMSNGTGHVTGYGWETGSSVPSIKLIGVTSAGNFSGDSHLNSGGTVVTNIPHACSLP